jgi:hypothetical protein
MVGAHLLLIGTHVLGLGYFWRPTWTNADLLR